MRLILILLCAAVCAADAPNTSPWPLWDGVETVEQYAQRVKLPATKSLDLGGGVKLDLVLIPAGKFIMGEPKPEPVDEEGFQKKIVLGQALLAMGGGLLLILLGVVLFRALRNRSRPRFSLALFLGMTAAAGIALLGGMHCRYSLLALAEAQAKYQPALVQFQEAAYDEKPAHKVTLTTPFYMGKYHVTQEQYQQLIGTNPSRFKGKDNPVEQVSWDDAQAFCKKLTEQMKETVRLPTEAEWEYACRAGTRTKYYFGDAEKNLDRVAWHDGNSNSTTHPVGQKVPNRFGLYDMHGNVLQWCEDLYGDYSAERSRDPQGPSQGDSRVLRGGSLIIYPRKCRTAKRYWSLPEFRDFSIGFRVVAAVPRTP